MKPNTSQESSQALPPAARAEAAAWVARLHSSGRSRALEAGLRRWLQANPAHGEAFELATEAWEIGSSIPTGALPRIAQHPYYTAGQPRSSGAGAVHRPRFALAAALGVAVIGSLLYLNSGKPAVTTGVGEQRMLTLEDGSRIFLNTDTRLLVQINAARRQIRLESGEALFDVAHDAQRPFVVSIGDKEVLALGTAFLVRRDPKQLTVTLMEGKIQVAAKEHAKILTPGQRLTFTGSQPPTLDVPGLEKVTAWRRGEVILDKTRLADAVEEMNRYSTVKLIVARPQDDIRVSGIFRAGDSARFAQAVAETYHLKIAHRDRQIVLSKSPP